MRLLQARNIEKTGWPGFYTLIFRCLVTPSWYVHTKFAWGTLNNTRYMLKNRVTRRDHLWVVAHCKFYCEILSIRYDLDVLGPNLSSYVAIYSNKELTGAFGPQNVARHKRFLLSYVTGHVIIDTTMSSVVDCTPEKPRDSRKISRLKTRKAKRFRSRPNLFGLLA